MKNKKPFYGYPFETDFYDSSSYYKRADHTTNWPLQNNTIQNKTVLLRERERHTVRRVVSTHPAVLSREGWGGGVLHPVMAGGGTPSCPGQWGPHQSWPGGYPFWPGWLGGGGT